MAQLRRVTPSNPLSNFRQSAPPSGGAFRLMAEVADDAYRSLLPAAEKEMQAYGEGVGREIARQQIGDPKGAMAVASMAAAPPPSGDGWLRYSNQGATRDKPINSSLSNAMSFLPEMGITMEVFSGGQDGIGEGDRRTGSVRHDHGNAADVFFYKDGRRLDWANEADRPLFEEIVRRGKAAGVTGFGAGDGYMQAGSMHLGFGNPGVWGAGGKGENAAEWLRAAYDGEPSPAGGVTVSTSGQPAFTPTMLREADGKLTGRLFSPLSGPLLQVANAAAGVAYQSDVTLKAQTDLMGLSEQFKLDPEGFGQAAQGYMDDILKAAPEMFRSDLRGTMEKEVQRRFLGMVEERQRDIAQRADNSSRALVERYSDDYAAALVGGNEEEIAAAREQLGSVLTARESLPGASWTQDQSQNIIIKAEDAARRETERAQKEQTSAWKGQLSTIYDAAKNMRTAVDEAILQNPIVEMLLPEEVRKARSATILRDQMPSFMRMTPTEQAAAIEEMRAQPVGAPWENDLFETAEDAALDNAKAWDKDPIQRAAEVLPEKPPALPSGEEVLNNPAAFTQALSDRAAYAQGLKEKGYVDFVTYLTDEEAKEIGAMFGKDVPPDVRAAMAGAVVAGLGDASGQFFKDIKSDDPVLKMSGMLLARGGDQVTAGIAMRGQALIDEGLVQVPSVASSVKAVAPDVAAALSAVPGAAEADVMKFATAIYAAEARGLDPNSPTAKAKMKEAVQQALGQTTSKRGDVLGGVQRVAGSDVLLPPGVSGAALDEAISGGFAPVKEMGAWDNFGAIWGGVDRRPVADIWGAAGIGQSKGSIPMMGGEPVPASLFSDGRVRLVPTANGAYRMQVQVGGGVRDVLNANGTVFQFDAQALIDAKVKAAK